MASRASAPDGGCVYCGRWRCDGHHHPPRKMGGSKKWTGTLVPLCRRHHEDLHMKRWRLEVKDGMATGYSREGELLFTRRLETDSA